MCENIINTLIILRGIEIIVQWFASVYLWNNNNQKSRTITMASHLYNEMKTFLRDKNPLQMEGYVCVFYIIHPPCSRYQELKWDQRKYVSWNQFKSDVFIMIRVLWRMCGRVYACYPSWLCQEIVDNFLSTQ